MALPKMNALIACLVISMLVSSAKCVSEDSSVYEVLEMFNLPRGLLPTNAKGYSLNADGSFEVYLDGSCSFGIEAGYRLKYKSKISGSISTGSLENLGGISVKVFFVWLDISAVELVNGQLQFYVGPLSAAFPLSNFDECPTCGCGLDCVSRPTLVSEY